ARGAVRRDRRREGGSSTAGRCGGCAASAPAAPRAGRGQQLMGSALMVAAVCLVCEAFFSGSEIAVVAADRLKIRRGVDAGRRSARLLQRFLATPQRLLATTLMGTQTAVVTSTIVVTLALSDRHPQLAELYTLAALTPTLVILGEIMPKSLAHQHADRLA